MFNTKDTNMKREYQDYDKNRIDSEVISQANALHKQGLHSSHNYSRTRQAENYSELQFNKLFIRN